MNQSPAPTVQSDLQIHVFCSIATVIVLLVDLNLPLGIAGGVPYIIVVLLSLSSADRRITTFYALVCSGATILGYYLSPLGGEEWQVLTNRTLAVFAIWAVAVLGSRWESRMKEVAHLKSDLLREREQIYAATVQSSQNILRNLLNKLQVVQDLAEQHASLGSEISETLAKTVEEGAVLMVKLSSVTSSNVQSVRESGTPDRVAGAAASE